VTLKKVAVRVVCTVPEGTTAEEYTEAVERLLLDAGEQLDREYRRGTRSVEGPVEVCMLQLSLCDLQAVPVPKVG